MKIAFSTAARAATPADLLVVGVAGSPGEALADLDAALHGALLTLLARQKFSGKAGDVAVYATFGALAAPRVAFVGLGERTPDDLAAAAGKAGMLARDERADTLALDLGPLDAAAARAVLEHVQIGNYFYDAWLAEDARKPRLTAVTVLANDPTPERDAAAHAATVRGRWQRFTRDLVNAPAAEIYPATLAAKARELEGLPHVEVEVWDVDRCRAEGLVGIVAVGQGSVNPGCLVHIRYRPEGAREHVALVGKGVTFDSGGLSLKPSAAMQTMRCDMGGGATVLGAVGAAASLGVPVAIDAFVPAVENMCASASYKLGDILRYKNGVTVEIHNTDAEGRLILADALILASRVPGVTRVVDLATLTGAIVISLGQDFTGLFTPDDGLAAELTAAAAATSERLWRQPLHGPYNRMFKGTWGKLKNVGGREAGSITAALFLEHFVEKGVRWAHLDIAGTAYADAAVDPYVVGGTGQLVRGLVTWLEDLAGA